MVLFDQEYPFSQQPSVVAVDAETMLYESSQAAAIARLQQIAELTQNAEWQRCGVFIQWREDGVSDPQDGWYDIVSAPLSEDYLFSSYAEFKLAVELRQRQRQSVGIFVDSKLLPNDANLAGTGLAALPMGFQTQYPASTWTFAGANGNILAVENPISIMRALLQTPTTVMTQGRCRVSDQTVNRSTQTEVFWKDHRNINGNWEIANDLLRYYFAEGANAPSIDVWTGAAWTLFGTYQLRVTNAGAILPLQSVQFQTISPEEVVWTERRYDTAGTALVVVTNRIRRGSRLIESQIVSASGAGLTDTQSISIIASSGTWTAGQSADGTGVAFTDSTPTTRVPGFCYLTKNATAPGVSALILFSGLTVPAGTISRLGVLCGYQDAQWTSLGATAALYSARWASYNRQRMRQRIEPALVA